MDLNTKKVFLTGASGVVGQALIARMDPRSVICLVRQTALRSPDVMTVKGDIELPKFGWTNGRWRDIANRIDCVVHAAAITSFHKPAGKVMQANVDSLDNIFELCAASKAPLYHISSAFVRPARIPGNNKELAYAISKREAERRVRESGLPHVIVRPSIVIGDSTSGAIARLQGFHSILGGVLDGSLPILPASPHAYIDCVPQDTLAEVILALIAEGRMVADYWITAGERAITMSGLSDILDKYAAGQGFSFTRPRFVTPDMVERLLRPVFLPALPASVQRRFERLLKMSAYLLIDEVFPTSLPELGARLHISPLPDLELAVLRGLDFWDKAGRWTNG